MSTPTLAEEVLSCIKEKEMTASGLFKLAGIEKFRGYDIINGKLPSRDEILRLTIALGVSPEDTQRMLNESGYPMLNPEDGRESAILFALKQGGDVEGLNEALKDMGYPPVGQ